MKIAEVMEAKKKAFIALFRDWSKNYKHERAGRLHSDLYLMVWCSPSNGNARFWFESFEDLVDSWITAWN